MTRNEYTNRVLAVMRRATAAEREAIRTELDAHMEDHMEALLDLGYEPELAEQRTMERMGDPEEVGRELNNQYPPIWLLLKRTAKILSILAVLLLLVSGWSRRDMFTDNLWGRFYPIHILDMQQASFGYGEGPIVDIAETVDLRQTVNGVTMRVYQAGLKDSDTNCMGWIAVCWYSENPFKRAPQLLGDVTMPDGREVVVTGWSSLPCFTVNAPAEPGEEMEFTYKQNGHQYHFVVELPWEEGIS